MEIMGKVGLMNLTVCPVGETTTQRGAVMSSFETQQVTLRTKSKSKPKKVQKKTTGQYSSM